MNLDIGQISKELEKKYDKKTVETAIEQNASLIEKINRFDNKYVVFAIAVATYIAWALGTANGNEFIEDLVTMIIVVMITISAIPDKWRKGAAYWIILGASIVNLFICMEFQIPTEVAKDIIISVFLFKFIKK